MVMFGKFQVRNLGIHGKKILKWVSGKQVSKVIDWFGFARDRVVTTLVHNSNQFLNELNGLASAFPCLRLSILYKFIISPVRCPRPANLCTWGSRARVSVGVLGPELGSSTAVGAGLPPADLACIGAAFPPIEHAPGL
jgi:hypothetical protein